jgi:hypothetical protein
MTAQQRDMIDQILRNAPFDLGGDVAAQRPLLEGDADRDHQAQDVHRQAPLAAGRLLPGVPPGRLRGTDAAECTLWVSSTTRLGSALRPFFSRACQRSRSWITWSVPSSRHLAK